MLLPFLLLQHKVWRHCNMRIFTVASMTVVDVIIGVQVSECAKCRCRRVWVATVSSTVVGLLLCWRVH